MFAQVRSTLVKVHTSSPLRSVCRAVHTRNSLDSINNNASADRKQIEQKTLAILESTVNSNRDKPIAEAAQRYQKIHRAGDLYHPDDLNDIRYQELLRQRRGKFVTPKEDPFEVLGLDPLVEYKNYKLLSQFVSDMGKILPRSQTGMSAKNQRKLAKAIKRARAMGLMSSTSNQVDFKI